MHELRCGGIYDGDGSHELCELRFRHLLDVGRGLGIVNMFELCGGHLRCEHGIDVMHIMQREYLLSGEL